MRCDRYGKTTLLHRVRAGVLTAQERTARIVIGKTPRPEFDRILDNKSGGATRPAEKLCGIFPSR